MLAPNETVQHLQAARNLIETCYHAGPRITEDEEHVCALEALLVAQGRDPWADHWTSAALPSSLVEVARKMLRGLPQSNDPDPYVPVYAVNDTLGQSATLRMFDLAIQAELIGEP